MNVNQYIKDKLIPVTIQTWICLYCNMYIQNTCNCTFFNTVYHTTIRLLVVGRNQSAFTLMYVYLH